MLKVQAPTRIDFAGGTIDIPPLFELHGGAVTLNAAIDKYATVEIEDWNNTAKKAEYRIISQDLGVRAEFTAKNKSGPEWEKLKLIGLALDHFEVKNVEVQTRINLPKGSGLAASSALCIALCTGLNKWAQTGLSQNDLIKTARKIEEEIIETTAGWQDYYPAMFGGFNALHLKEGKENKNEQLVLSGKFTEKLQQNMLLAYTGVPHHSGRENEKIVEAHQNGDQKIIDAMAAVKKTAQKMYSALKDESFERFADLLKEDWKNRKKLSPSVTTPEIDRIIEVAYEKGAMAARVCGAGGGGFMVIIASPEKQKEIQSELTKMGTEFYDFTFDANGTQII